MSDIKFSPTLSIHRLTKLVEPESQFCFTSPPADDYSLISKFIVGRNFPRSKYDLRALMVYRFMYFSFNLPADNLLKNNWERLMELPHRFHDFVSEYNAHALESCQSCWFVEAGDIFPGFDGAKLRGLWTFELDDDGAVIDSNFRVDCDNRKVLELLSESLGEKMGCFDVCSRGDGNLYMKWQLDHACEKNFPMLSFPYILNKEIKSDINVHISFSGERDLEGKCPGIMGNRLPHSVLLSGQDSGEGASLDFADFSVDRVHAFTSDLAGSNHIDMSLQLYLDGLDEGYHNKPKAFYLPILFEKNRLCVFNHTRTKMYWLRSSKDLKKFRNELVEKRDVFILRKGLRCWIAMDLSVDRSREGLLGNDVRDNLQWSSDLPEDLPELKKLLGAN